MQAAAFDDPKNVKRYASSYHNQTQEEVSRAHLCSIHILSFDICMCVSHSVGWVSLSLRVFPKYESDYTKLTIRSRPLSASFICSQTSLCVRLAVSHPISVISFHLASCSVHHAHITTHMDRCTPHTSAHRDTEMYAHPPTPFQALPNERHSSDATGRRPPSAANEYSAVHCTSKLLMCGCVWSVYTYNSDC